jgi:hypothetical protein
MTNHNQGRGRTAEAAATKEETQREERKTERVSMAQSEILAYKTDPNYHYRWFNAKQEWQHIRKRWQGSPRLRCCCTRNTYCARRFSSRYWHG